MRRAYCNNISDTVESVFPVIDQINAAYPGYYKFICKKYDNSDRWICICTEEYSSSSITVLVCNKQDIIYSKTLTGLSTHTNFYSLASINNKFFFLLYNGGRSITLHHYEFTDSSITFTRSLSAYNWTLSSSAFAYTVDDVDYLTYNGNQAYNGNVLYNTNTGNISKNNASFNVYSTCLTNNYSDSSYPFVCVATSTNSGNIYYNKIVIVKMSNLTVNKGSWVQISNTLDFYAAACQFPLYNDPSILKTFVPSNGTTNQFWLLDISSDYSTIAVTDRYIEYTTKYYITVHGMLLTSESSCYTCDYLTENKDLVLVSF